MVNEKCLKCGSTNTYWHEEHPDTGMDEMVLRCRDCVKKTQRLPWSFRMREKIRNNCRAWFARAVVDRLFRLARWSARYGSGRCTWCGCQPGFQSQYNGKGLRCMVFGYRDCTKF